MGAARFGTVAEDVGALCAHAASGARVFPVPAAPAKLALRALEAVHLSPLYRWVYGTADRDSYVSTDRIQKVLGWRPRYSNAEALIRAYDWYLQNREALAAPAEARRPPGSPTAWPGTRGPQGAQAVAVAERPPLDAPGDRGRGRSRTYRVDLHSHTGHSKDSLCPAGELLDAAVRRGLSGLAVTDHDTLDGASQALAIVSATRSATRA